jgi:hypothetical protein
LKKPLIKKSGGVAQSVGPKFKPQYHKKQKRNAVTCLTVRVTDLKHGGFLPPGAQDRN